jgi:hypothetical protein
MIYFIILLILVSYCQVVERDGLKRELESFLKDFEAIQNELKQTRKALKQNEDQIEQFRTREGIFI